MILYSLDSFIVSITRYIARETVTISRLFYVLHIKFLKKSRGGIEN
jgi:hypothetical protein